MTDLLKIQYGEIFFLPITKNERNRKFSSIGILTLGIWGFFLSIGILFMMSASKDNVPIQFRAVLFSFIILLESDEFSFTSAPSS